MGVKGLNFYCIWHHVQYANNIHGYNTRYAAKNNFYKPKVWTNVGKQSISYMVIDIWNDLPPSLTDLSVISFL